MPPPDEILGCLEPLEVIFREPLSSREAVLYVDALADIPLGELQAAVLHLVRHRPRFFPTPGEIREAVLQASPRLALPPPEHAAFPDPAPGRSLDEIAATRRALAPLWGEVRRALNGGELRPFDDVLAELGIPLQPNDGGE